jgi:hypothetical protein
MREQSTALLTGLLAWRCFAASFDGAVAWDSMAISSTPWLPFDGESQTHTHSQLAALLTNIFCVMGCVLVAVGAGQQRCQQGGMRLEA